MINRVGLFLEEYKKIGAALNKAQDAYNAAEAKLDTKGQSIIYTSNKLIKLGARNSPKALGLPAYPASISPWVTQERT